jgi:hypothetical protein
MGTEHLYWILSGPSFAVRQHSGFESGHPLNVINGRNNQKSGKHTLESSLPKIYKKSESTIVTMLRKLFKLGCFSFTVVTARDFLVGDAFSLKVGSLHALLITGLIMQYAVKAGNE